MNVLDTSSHGDITDIYFRIQIPKISACIEQWKRRILTPFGRTTVIKSLLIPKLFQLFISIPTPKIYLCIYVKHF